MRKQTRTEFDTVNRLMSYRHNRLSISHLEERIALLESKKTAIKASRADSTPVSGGTNSREDNLIDVIMEQRDCQHRLEIVRAEVKSMERAINDMAADEREAIMITYVNRPRGYIGELCDKLNIEESQAYRLRNRALKNLAGILYGEFE